MDLYLLFLDEIREPWREKRDRVFFSSATWSTKEIFPLIMKEKHEKFFWKFISSQI